MVALANFNPIWFVRGVRLLFASLLLWFAVPHHAICKPGQLRIPPVGETTTVRVMRGESIEVTLKAFESQGNNPLAYDVVSYPQHGRLGDIRQADRNRQGFASVVYTHDDDENSTSDEFTFKARSLGGSGVSSPIKVKLQIVDAPPQLQVTPRADFSAVAGESDRQQIILANVGGGLIEGRIAPKDPFHVEGEDRFSLGRGAMTNIVIRFSPTRTESVAPQKLAPAPADPGATITLRGEVSAPFEVSTEPLKVDATGARSGLIVISNLASAPLAVDLELTPKGAAEVSSREEIPPQSTAQIPVTISSEKTGGAFNLNVALSSPFHRQDLTFEVPAVPPRLELVTPELDFRGSNEAVLIVKNSGGTAGRFSIEPEAGGSIKPIEGAQNFAVEPGQIREITLLHEPKKKSQDPDFLEVLLGKEGKVPVPLLFAAPEPSPSPTRAVSTPSTSPTPSPMPWELNSDVKLEKTDGQFFVGWSEAKSGLTHAILEIVDQAGSRAYDSEKGSADNTWWDTLKDWWTGRKEDAKEAWQEKEKFFGDRLTVPGEEAVNEELPQPSKNTWSRAAVRENEASVWRITARRGKDGVRRTVSPDFEIDWRAQTLVPAKPKAADLKGDAQPGDEAVTPGPPPPLQPPIAPMMVEPARKIKGDVISERTRATVRLAIDEDREIDGFRLERGEMVAALDAKTGIPTRSEFVPLAHAGNVTISAPAAAEHEGKKLTVVVATIDGLQPGTATFWRLVPLSGDKELMPTEEFLVPTAPPWQFPWRAFFLGLLTALLVSVLWLRHKSRKASRS